MHLAICSQSILVVFFLSLLTVVFGDKVPTYRTEDGYLCYQCPPGHRVTNHCMKDYTMSECEVCAPTFYTKSWNRVRFCSYKEHCPENQEILYDDPRNSTFLCGCSGSMILNRETNQCEEAISELKCPKCPTMSPRTCPPVTPCVCSQAPPCICPDCPTVQPLKHPVTLKSDTVSMQTDPIINCTDSDPGIPAVVIALLIFMTISVLVNIFFICCRNDRCKIQEIQKKFGLIKTPVQAEDDGMIASERDQTDSEIKLNMENGDVADNGSSKTFGGIVVEENEKLNKNGCPNDQTDPKKSQLDEVGDIFLRKNITDTYYFLRLVLQLDYGDVGRIIEENKNLQQQMFKGFLEFKTKKTVSDEEALQSLLNNLDMLNEKAILREIEELGIEIPPSLPETLEEKRFKAGCVALTIALAERGNDFSHAFFIEQFGLDLSSQKISGARITDSYIAEWKKTSSTKPNCEILRENLNTDKFKTLHDIVCKAMDAVVALVDVGVQVPEKDTESTSINEDNPENEKTLIDFDSSVSSDIFQDDNASESQSLLDNETSKDNEDNIEAKENTVNQAISSSFSSRSSVSAYSDNSLIVCSSLSNDSQSSLC